jgi:hypothetical protein
MTGRSVAEGRREGKKEVGRQDDGGMEKKKWAGGGK